MGCGGLTYGFCEISGIPNALLYGVLSVSGAFTIYNFQRIVKSKTAPNESNHLKWVTDNRQILSVATFIGAVGCGVTAYYLIHWSWAIVFVGILSSFISVFYVVKIGSKNLRDIPRLKIYLISIIWIVAISIFPLLNEQMFELKIWLFGLVHGLYFFAICIPFDIRDLAFDHANQRTIPQVVGVQSAKMIGILLLVVFIITAVYLMPSLGNNKLFITSILLQIMFIYLSSRNQPDFYYGIMIDGSILLLGTSYLV